MSRAPRAPDGLALSDLIRLALGKLGAELHVAFPARVQSIDAGGNRVDVLPQFKRNIEAIDKSRVVEELPVIPSVPIAWPRSKGYAITWPLTTDDTVMVVVTDRNLGDWLEQNRAIDVGDVRTHILDGAVAVPGLYARENELGGTLPDHLSLRSLAAGGCSVDIRDSEVRVGTDGATKAPATAPEVWTELTRIQATLASLSGATFGITYTAPASSSLIGASKVKVT